MQLSKIVPTALAIFMLSSILSATEAAEKVLCVVSSDVDKNTGRMTYEMDEDGRGIKHIYMEAYENGKLTERKEVDMSEINGDGIILHQKDKYVTVRLFSHNFDEERGGVLYLDTLYNAVKGERKEYQIEVAKNAQSEIVMMNNKKEFNNMKFIGKKAPIIGVIGIEKVNFTKN